MATKSVATKKKSVFERLSSINVNSKVEKKNNLTYLSWAYAWAETKKHCPDATYVVGETDYDEALGFMCHTSVTIEGETLEMWLPVMDGSNKAMKKTSYEIQNKWGSKQVAHATMFDINKTIMRCLVKNLAMFGMGIYIYAGEDMPSEDDVIIPKEKPTKTNSTAKPILDVTSERWKGLIKFAEENKSLGYKKLVDKLETSGHCQLSANAKNEVKNLVKPTK